MTNVNQPGSLQEGNLVHRTEIQFLGHRIWLQDDTDATTDPQTVASAIAAALLPAPLGDAWKPRVAQIGRAQVEAINDMSSLLLTLKKMAEPLAGLDQ